MTERTKIDYLTIKEFKSIKRLERLPLRDLNVLIGPNGSGKSNFLDFFCLLHELAIGHPTRWITQHGGIDHLRNFGVKNAGKIHGMIKSSMFTYEFRLKNGDPGDVYDISDQLTLAEGGAFSTSLSKQGKLASFLGIVYGSRQPASDADHFRQGLMEISTYHFHDTTDRAGVRRPGSVRDNQYLRFDASNLAAFLLALRIRDADSYQLIRETIQLALPFFDDFYLRPLPITGGDNQVSLFWKQRDSDYAFWPNELSDGSIRFICLTTALLQPEPPSTIIIDEPELSLHPYAITLLGGLLRSASERMQVIVATQSVPLVNEFSVDDLIVVEREDGASVFQHPNEANFKQLLEEYSVGELWKKLLD